MASPLLLGKLGLSGLKIWLKNSNLGSGRGSKWQSDSKACATWANCPSPSEGGRRSRSHKKGRPPLSKAAKLGLLLPFKLVTTQLTFIWLAQAQKEAAADLLDATDALSDTGHSYNMGDNTANFTKSIPQSSYTATKENEDSRVDVKWCWRCTAEKGNLRSI